MKLESTYLRIGTIIRARRRQLDLSQEKLAQKLRISRATLANIETGRQRILVHQLYALAESLGMKPEDLLPRVSASATPSEWAHLPIPTDLKPQQKEQIAQIIKAAEVPASAPTGRTNEKV